MTFDEYQKRAMETAEYPDMGLAVYPALGLAGETGELVEKIKKLHRDRFGQVDRAYFYDLMKEAGDCLWYLAVLCDELDMSFSQVAQANLDKLTDRALRNVLKGSGDDR